MTAPHMKRLGRLMEPEPGNANETEGVLNPAAARGRDGHLYIFPRLVAKGNYSRIGIARIIFNGAGDPCGVERLGIALEPEADYEFIGEGKGGCEDPRVTFVAPLGHYVMSYTALSAHGPRIALAVSEDLVQWRRLGLATFEPYGDIEFNGVDNKDASVFPTAIPGPDGRPSLAIIHRPLFPGTRPEEKAARAESEVADLHRESIWISYRDMSIESGAEPRLCHFTSHHRLASPVASWEKVKIGGGPPPVLTPHGWLLIYHGVSNQAETKSRVGRFRYSAGMMLLSPEAPNTILYRSREPILTPVLPEERIGIIGNVVFPTGIDRRDDIGQPDRFDVFYGMADDRIGVARLNLPAGWNPQEPIDASRPLATASLKDAV